MIADAIRSYSNVRAVCNRDDRGCNPLDQCDMPRPKRLPRTGPFSARNRGWTALTGSGTSGGGLTARDAETAARLSRLKEVTQVIYLPTDQAQPLALPAVFERVVRG